MSNFAVSRSSNVHVIYRRIDECIGFYNLVIGGSVFTHKKVHKATWVSLDHSTENQIDHICVSKKFRRSLQDVRVKKGVDTATDHLLTGTLWLKLKKFTNTVRSARDTMSASSKTVTSESNSI